MAEIKHIAAPSAEQGNVDDGMLLSIDDNPSSSSVSAHDPFASMPGADAGSPLKAFPLSSSPEAEQVGPAASAHAAAQVPHSTAAAADAGADEAAAEVSESEVKSSMPALDITASLEADAPASSNGGHKGLSSVSDEELAVEPEPESSVAAGQLLTMSQAAASSISDSTVAAASLPATGDQLTEAEQEAGASSEMPPSDLAPDALADAATGQQPQPEQAETADSEFGDFGTFTVPESAVASAPEPPADSAAQPSDAATAGTTATAVDDVDDDFGDFGDFSASSAPLEPAPAPTTTADRSVALPAPPSPPANGNASNNDDDDFGDFGDFEDAPSAPPATPPPAAAPAPAALQGPPTLLSLQGDAFLSEVRRHFAAISVPNGTPHAPAPPFASDPTDASTSPSALAALRSRARAALPDSALVACNGLPLELAGGRPVAAGGDGALGLAGDVAAEHRLRWKGTPAEARLLELLGLSAAAAMSSGATSQDSIKSGASGLPASLTAGASEAQELALAATEGAGAPSSNNLLSWSSYDTAPAASFSVPASFPGYKQQDLLL